MEENLALKSVEIARRFIELNQIQEAINAYILAVKHNNGENPEIDVESALFVFNNKGDYKFSYTIFVTLYNKGFYQNEIFDILVDAFYTPNALKIKRKFNKNIKMLKEYKYLFKTKFHDFDNLKIKFFPFDDQGFIPFYPEENRFGEYINVNNPVVDRYFFKDLENPILADDVYSQYHLEYLYDNVRRSEWVAKDNHIYLHYNDFAMFCAYLQVLDFGNLLSLQKFVFLIEDEISLYPLDFKNRFDIDYSTFTVKPIAVSEVNRLIWHTQLSAHNGGDFFNEILDGHPNLLSQHSMMLTQMEESLHTVYNVFKNFDKSKSYIVEYGDEKVDIAKHLRCNRHVTLKDCFVAMYLSVLERYNVTNDISRVAPAIVFQPHFKNIMSEIVVIEDKYSLLYTNAYEKLKKFKVLKSFKYIKTFTPLRRISTSYAAACRYMFNMVNIGNYDTESLVVGDFNPRIINRSFYVDKYDKLYSDSRLVRFEDGKLNPKATFTALAEFLDIPYTDSMKDCTYFGIKDIKSADDNVIGFDTSSVYKQYEDFAFDHEKYLIEYFFRDVYKLYGYDFMFYDGKELTFEEIEEMINRPWKIESFELLSGNIHKLVEKLKLKVDKDTIGESDEELIKRIRDEIFEKQRYAATFNAEILYENPYFVNKKAQPLIPMKQLKLDPALLEQPLYK